MALGGGTFTSQNKILPGTYINFVSLAKAGSMLSERGTVAIGMPLNWGEENKIISVTRKTLASKELTKLLGYEFGAEELKWLREIMRNASTVLLYRLNGGGAKAENAYATAKYTGARGNDLNVVIKSVPASKFEVSLYLSGTLIDKQIVATAAELKPNDFVDWKTTATLEATAGTPLTGGSNGTASGETHQAFLSLLESASYNALGLTASDPETKQIYAAYVKRVREEIGQKVQLVVHDLKADYEGVINVKNDVNLVYWVLGAIGGCPIEKSTMNRKYDGEYPFKADYTQTELEEAIGAGEYVLHKVGDEARVLMDINSFTTYTEAKSVDFRENQTIRVLDQVGTDIAKLFNDKYLGKINNTDSGRTSLWSDIVTYNAELVSAGAVEKIASKEIVVELGDDRRSVVVTNPIKPLNAMQRLYVTVIVG